MSNLPDELNSIFTTKNEQDIKKEIVVELLDSNKNLDEKTELSKPLSWACMKSMKEYIEGVNLPMSAKILENFNSQAFKLLISKDRKGREEYIRALNSLANFSESKPEIDSLLKKN